MSTLREMFFGADPIKNPKMNHVYCKRCGSPLYAPMPTQEQERQWCVFAWTVLVIAYLHDCGWRTIKDGQFNGYFVCPNCLTSYDTDFKKPVIDEARLYPYKEWVAEQRAKYNYYGESGVKNKL